MKSELRRWLAVLGMAACLAPGVVLAQEQAPRPGITAAVENAPPPRKGNGGTATPAERYALFVLFLIVTGAAVWGVTMTRVPPIHPGEGKEPADGNKEKSSPS